ncbi:MAG TPA: methionyl-tRNA formyltransferase [Phycisphaerae bacterium]|nr:methionyl-tRNA formyltransferase [Phycisphaerae bacterium]HPS52684.1 methionyl-tRNA formyltransferase [Phycisphaerae bacterium]
MRIIFCGSGTFALPSFEAVADSRHDLVLAVTQPPRKSGRGGKINPTVIAQAAYRRGIDCLETQDINSTEALRILQSCNANVMVVAEYGQFIREAARKSVSRACFNLHGSILPALRGAAPVNRAVINGDAESGVTTFELVDKMDAGAVYRTEKVQITPNETAGELREKLAAVGTKVVLATLDDIEAGIAQPVEQDASLATFAPKLQKSDGYVDFEQSVGRVYDRIRGCSPWPGAAADFAKADGKTTRVIITRSEIASGQARGAAGTIDDEFCVATGDGRLKILEIQPAGRKNMDFKSFVNGYRVLPGDRFLKISE